MNRNKVHKVINLNEFERTQCNRYYSDEIKRTDKDKWVTCLLCLKMSKPLTQF